ncbi:ribonucleoside-diphosphate reductase [Methylobacterium oryzae]|uniref:ribonucleoside-diphosphate reductase n=1 Tax=Methylobacterium oryzae TaxID=334852 RepID=UPI001F38499B|nr:ribonucleoside-diphosphate reductase [Methylobacterium oryzae]UIN38350.1 ribonucleoside-diphosphate reductase [Methylobacterium oryzae]
MAGLSPESLTPARSYFPGMGQAVADRTVNRKIQKPYAAEAVVTFKIPRDDSTSLDSQVAAYAKSQGYGLADYHVDQGDDVTVSGWFIPPYTIQTEEWADVAYRVAVGNASLDRRLRPAGMDPVDAMFDAGTNKVFTDEFGRMHHHLRQASLLMSGRHLQHGDATQRDRNMEVFTNCSTSATTFLLFYLLLNGSGVGRDYSDAMIRADLNQMPIVVPVIDWNHADVGKGLIQGYLTERDARHLYAGRTITTFKVPDSREGWAKAVEIIERFAFEGRREEVLILDFTDVRPNGAPIAGMQGRPASGPGPLMGAIKSIAQVRDAGMAPWRAALYADHYAAECVLVGGARRAARMATKFWKDRTVLDFISVKRGGFLWSSNNSVTIDEEFRSAVRKLHQLAGGYEGEGLNLRLNLLQLSGQITDDEAHAYRVLRAAAHAAYHDGTGEPGFINQDKLTSKPEGLDAYLDGLIAESAKFKLDVETLPLMKSLVEACAALGWPMITNPCGEICLLMLGAYCVIADVVPFHASSDDDAEDAFRTAVRALIRTNTMDSLYSREVKRTNRIGVGMTGFHEWAYDRFGFTWHDLVDEEKSKALWLTVSRFKRAVVDEARSFSELLGVTVPHTDTTFKPAGTTSKLFGLTEGAHLPSMREFLRWVQFRNDDPLVKVYEEKGYPARRLKSYSGTTIVGFPTKPAICELGDGQWVVTAAEATPEEQYQFLRLLEKYWLTGVEEDGVTPLSTESGNQISYTLKYDPKEVSYGQFLETLIEGQFSIRCCSVMPQADTTAYEYQPEDPVTKLEFQKIVAAISNDNEVKEEIGFEHVDCGTGGCPVDFNEEKAA